jgi:hypothetical protein
MLFTADTLQIEEQGQRNSQNHQDNSINTNLEMSRAGQDSVNKIHPQGCQNNAELQTKWTKTA